MYESDKRAAALAAVEEVRDGMIVGLGTGSTAAFAIAAIGARVRAGLAIRGVATSLATGARARAEGITVIDLPPRIDLTIDGADEVDGQLRAIKGAGGAMLREKIVAVASERMLVIADASKRVERIGAALVPVEVLPFAARFVAGRLEALGAAVTLRVGQDDGPACTDQGDHVLDCRFSSDSDLAALASAIAAIPGALGHGLFLTEVSAAYFAADGVVTRVERGRRTQ